ncbi:interleukin-15 receptor subunit alpha [Rhinatrema bivittatum]|uniref:interleukin-15 receptor subunit alpha n=1 Tax=Rhinatrema bivittatum TaxID=194408 RepID=UPI00112EAACB|nr:interleukin-15 receptor subunit alpha [Rhinatrema bivittatum]
MAPGALLLLLLLHPGRQTQPPPLPEKCGHPGMVTNTNAFSAHYFHVGERLRYECRSGYKRKAGTSSLITCMKNGNWTMSNMRCIRDISLASPTSATIVKSTTSSTPPTTEATHLPTPRPFSSFSTDVRTPPLTNYIPQLITTTTIQTMTINLSVEKTSLSPYTTTKYLSSRPATRSVPGPTSTASQVPRSKASTLSTTANATSRPLTELGSLPGRESPPQPSTESSPSPGTTTSTSTLPESGTRRLLHSLGGSGAVILVLILALLGIFFVSRRRSKWPGTVLAERPVDRNLSEEGEVKNLLTAGCISSDEPNQETMEEITVL